jgi:hypothetical protein
MQYTEAMLKEHLGSKFDPKATYILETHRGAAARVAEGTHKTIGKVPDFSSVSESGTMIVMVKKPVAKVVDPGVGSGISSKPAPARQVKANKSFATAVPGKVAPPPPTPKVEEPVKAKPLTTEEVEAKVVVKPIWGPKAETKPTTKKTPGGSKK